MNESAPIARKFGCSQPGAQRALLLLAVLLASCGSGDPSAVDRSISISPASVAAGSARFEVVVVAPMLDDSAFRSGKAGAFVTWQRGAHVTILQDVRDSLTQRTAIIPAELLVDAGTASVSVGWWNNVTDDGPYLQSGRVSFVIEPIHQLPAVACTADSAGIGTVPAGDPLDAHDAGGAVRLADGQVLILGSETSAELYDPADNAFVPTGSMTRNRRWRTATLLGDGKVLVTGNGTAAEIADADVYDPTTGVFTPAGAMNENHLSPTASLLSDGRVLFTGGGGPETTSTGSLRTADIYDPGSGLFSAAHLMHETRRDHTATLLRNGKVLIAGGQNGDRRDSADDPPWDPIDGELFDPATNTFSIAGITSSTRYGHTATLLSDGRVLLTGGIPEGLQNIHEQPSPSYAEIYDPARPVDDSFSTLSSQLCRRTGFTSTLLDTGEVLILGGTGGDGERLATAELLDPLTGNSVVVGGLAEARSDHTAIPLGDGRVFIVGGTAADGHAVMSAELWSREKAGVR